MLALLAIISAALKLHLSLFLPSAPPLNPVHLFSLGPTDFSPSSSFSFTPPHPHDRPWSVLYSLSDNNFSHCFITTDLFLRFATSPLPGFAYNESRDVISGAAEVTKTHTRPCSYKTEDTPHSWIRLQHSISNPVISLEK